MLVVLSPQLMVSVQLVAGLGSVNDPRLNACETVAVLDCLPGDLTGRGETRAFAVKVFEPVAPLLSITATVTVYDPVAAYVWLRVPSEPGGRYRVEVVLSPQ